MIVGTAWSLRRLLIAGASLLLAASVLAQEAQVRAPDADRANMGVVDWLKRMHSASRRLNYMGTFVVSAPGGELSSARIWHAVDGENLYERVDVLTGPPRSILRRNSDVMTFMPDVRVVKSGHRELDLFPNLAAASDASIIQHYRARLVGQERVAGLEADILELMPRDSYRFGYRIWSEQLSGLLVKLQTIDASDHVVEQSAFSELRLDAPVDPRSLAQMMTNTSGYHVLHSSLAATTAHEEGWRLREAVIGFRPLSCYRRSLQALPGAGEGKASVGQDTRRMVQWTFSDGMATVSLFIEPFDARMASREGSFSKGATNSLSRRLATADGEWWLTAVGEVPPRTLEAFARNLERRKP